MSDVISQQFLDFDVAVVGGGPAGLAAAIALARSGARTALVARRLPYADNRTTALLGDSLAFLGTAGIWPRCADRAQPLRVMRLIDDSGRLVRAPELAFSCDEIGRDAFGHNIANRDLMAAMEAVADESGLTRIDADAHDIRCGETSVEIITGNGVNLSARLVVGADGRNSLCRQAAGIAMTSRPLAQAALTCNISHSRPHNDVSTEFHTAHGPCVFVPLPGNQSSVVWVMSADRAATLKTASSTELADALERQSHFHLGTLKVADERHVFPLSFGQAAKIADRRIVLVGEAAHVLPPIGAQGLNLGLRDAAAIGRIVADRLAAGDDLGAEPMLEAYRRERRGDIAKRHLVVGLANQSLLSDFLPAQMLRAAGMHLMNAWGPLRRLVMGQAIGPEGAADGPDAPVRNRTEQLTS